jgi:hypothetical protein
MSSILFLRDFAVWPLKAARMARVSASLRYSMGFLGLAGPRRAFAAWLSATRVMSSWDAIGQERFDGAEPQRDRLRRVVRWSSTIQASQDFQVLSVEVVEADVFALDVLVARLR